ncbi:hypothetical protein GE061_001220 [Apolygus lucorum]|uniref:DUF7041 domain-containing protein n=1 Tax=Apolygus lucorum TaxID=248454 RepID=A0A8S9Y6G3_APOLU|nr:hypothetical protein GE061_001220 [Apolygus lucorum]
MTQDTQTLDTLSSTTRLPAFLSADTKLWFLQAEAIFSNERITSQTTRFNRVIAVLPPEALRQVADLLTDPGEKPYSLLKDRLNSTYSRSESKSLQLLLDNPPISDQTPSQLLNDMSYRHNVLERRAHDPDLEIGDDATRKSRIAPETEISPDHHPDLGQERINNATLYMSFEMLQQLEVVRDTTYLSSYRALERAGIWCDET